MSFYRTGTIALTNGSAAVTGTGTDWINGAAAGEALQAPDGNLYEILSIQSATAMTLGQVYLGATASSQSYSIVPTQSYIRDLAGQAATLVNSYSATNTTALKTSDADKTTPVDADKLGMRDSVTGLGRLLSWANLKSALKTYFDSVATTLTNKTLTSPVISTISNTGTLTLPTSNDTLVGRATTDTLINKTVNLTSNTVTGTLAQFNAAVSDADLASISGAETLTNKTITDPTIDGVKYLATQSQLTFALDYALDQAAMANKRVSDATTFQTQTGTASFTQSASTELVRTYATATVNLPKAFKNTDYQVVIDPVSATPALGFQGEITVQSRTVNSFVLQMSGSATACSVRWKALHPNAEMRVHAVLPTAL